MAVLIDGTEAQGLYVQAGNELAQVAGGGTSGVTVLDAYFGDGNNPTQNSKFHAFVEKSSEGYYTLSGLLVYEYHTFTKSLFVEKTEQMESVGYIAVILQKEYPEDPKSYFWFKKQNNVVNHEGKDFYLYQYGSQGGIEMRPSYGDYLMIAGTSQ